MSFAENKGGEIGIDRRIMSLLRRRGALDLDTLYALVSRYEDNTPAKFSKALKSLESNRYIEFISNDTVDFTERGDVWYKSTKRRNPMAKSRSRSLSAKMERDIIKKIIGIIHKIEELDAKYSLELSDFDPDTETKGSHTHYAIDHLEKIINNICKMQDLDPGQFFQYIGPFKKSKLKLRKTRRNYDYY